jgi:hypothetical protein
LGSVKALQLVRESAMEWGLAKTLDLAKESESAMDYGLVMLKPRDLESDAAIAMLWALSKAEVLECCWVSEKMKALLVARRNYR